MPQNMTNAIEVVEDVKYDTPLLTEKQAADFLGFKPRALQTWRYRGGGPRFIAVSTRAVRYYKHDLVTWLNSKLKNSTSE